MTNTYGPDYSRSIDGERVQRQLEVIRDFMLKVGSWMTLAEIEDKLDYPQASISAQLRHLRKDRFGGYCVEKQRREADKGTWEYRVRERCKPRSEYLFNMQGR